MTDQLETIQALELRLAEQEQQHRRSEKVQSALYAIADAAGAVSDMQAFYARLHAVIGDLMYAHNFFIATLDEETGMLSWPYHVDEKDTDEQNWAPAPYREDKGITSYVLRTGRSTHSTSDTARLVSSGELEIIGTLPEDAIIVPLQPGGKTMGVLGVQSYEKDHVYSEQDVQVLTFVAQHIATALTRARAIEETRQRNQELAILNSVGEAMAKTLDVKTVTRIVGDKVLDIFGAEIASIDLLDRQTDLFHVLYTYDKGEGGYIDYIQPYPHGRGLNSRIVDTRQPLLLGTFREQQELDAYMAPESIEKGSGVVAESWMGVPIIAADQTLGVVSVANYRPNAFRDSDLRLLQTLSASMGIAIQNARLFEAEQQRIGELQIINSIQQGLASKLDLQAIIDLVGDKLREVLHTEEIGVRLYDEQTDLVHYLYEYEHGERLTMQPRQPSALFRELQANQRPIFGKTREISERYGLVNVPGTEVSKALANVPIIAGSKVIGGISVENYEREDAFDASNVRLMQTIASSMGVALENARLFDEVQKRNREISEALEQQTATSDILRVMAGSPNDIQPVLESVAMHAARLCEANDVQIYRVDGNSLRQAAHFGPLPALQDGEALPLAPGLVTGRAVLERRTIHIEDALQLSAAEYPESVKLQARLGHRTAISTPLLREGEAIGAIVVRRNEVRPFTGKRIALLSIFADQAAIAIENVRLFNETNRLLKETEQRAAELSVINSVQQGLASKLDMQAIYDLVGDRIRDIFGTEVVYIAIRSANRPEQIDFPYYLDRGNRLTVEPVMLGEGITSRVIQSRRPLVAGTMQQQTELGGIYDYGELSQSYLGVPIFLGDTIIGVASVQSYRPNAFGESDERLLTTLAASMGVALENARLFDETQRLLKETEQRAAELGIINSVQEGLASKLDMQAIYELVGEKVRDIFSAQSILIVNYDKATRMSHFAYNFEKGVRYYPGARPVAGITGHVIRSRQPVLINDHYLQREAEILGMNSEVLAGEDIKARLDVPMLVGGEATGVISLQNIDSENAFSESDLRLLQTLANSMSVALENARLFDETQRLLKETEQRAAELAIINSVQEGLASKLDMQAIYDLVGEKIREIFDAQSIMISIFDHERRMRSFPYMWEKGLRQPDVGLPFNVLTERLILDKRPVVINRDAESALVEYDMSQTPGTEPMKAGVFMPMLAGGRVTGFISLQNVDREEAFSDSDVRLLQTLANSMSVALENARLFNETQRLLKETEQRNAELAVINSVQGALAAKLDIQAIYDAVGNKLSDIFPNADVGIRVYDAAANLIHFPYSMEGGKRIYIDPIVRGNAGITHHVLSTRETLLINQNAEEESEKFGSYTIAGTQSEKSALYVPLVVGEEAKGLISLYDLNQENAFADSDVRLLTTVANSMSVALENARLFDETQRLLKETEQRNAELAVINSVQGALAAKLDIQAIYDAVGDKVGEIFPNAEVGIRIYDPATRLIHFPYTVEAGQRIQIASGPRRDVGVTDHVLTTRQPLLIDHDSDAEFAKLGSYTIPGTRDSKSALYVPMIVGAEVRGIISLHDLDREYAFAESDIRLLTTVANSMSVALENARLFDETQRLLKETEQRATELAIITSVQEGLASKLDMQAIYDLVGDKIRQVFDAQAILIVVFDHERQTDRIMYGFESGQQIHDDQELPFSPLVRHLVSTRQPVVINENTAEVGRSYGITAVPGTKPPKSLIFVPFGTAAQINGYFSLQNIDRENAFSDSDVRLLQTLAGSMGIALENARLFRAEQQRAAELAAIGTVSQALVAETDVDKVIQLIGDKMREIFRADIVYVALLDRTTNLIHFPYAFGDEFPALKYGEGLTSKILDGAQPLLINRDIDKKRAELGTQRVGKQAASYLGVPIMAGRQAIGVISVQSTLEENAFGEDDLRLLSTIAANAGAAIRTAQLHAETQRRAQEMATLAEIGNDIAASRELQPVLERIGAHAVQILSVRDLAISLRDADGGAFRTVVALGTYTEEMKDLVITPNRGIMGHILESGVAEFVNHPIQDPRVIHVPGTPVEEDERESLMGAPLISRGQTIGGIMVWRDHPDLFTQAELDFLVSVARQTAIAIESARLYLETQRRANEMSTLAEVGREISSSLEPAVVLEKIAARAKELLAAGSSAVFLLSPDKHTMQAITALGELDQEIKADAIRLGEGIIGTLALEGRAEFVNDTSLDPRSVQIPGTTEVQHESLMTAPLFRGEDVTGMMAVWRTTEPFDEMDLNFLVGLSRQAAIALENARLFEEIKRQGQYLETIFSNSPVAIVTVDEVGKVLSWSPAAEKLFGYTREEALGRDVDDLVASSDEVGVEARAYTHQGMDNQYVHRITKRTRKDGTLVDVDLSALPLPLEGGKTGVVAIYNDVGEIQRQRQYYEAIVQNSPVAIVAVDEQSNVFSWNPGAEQLFGYQREEALGRNIDDMVATTDTIHSEASTYNRQAMMDELHVITQRTRRDGSLVDVELSGVPLPLPTGKSGLVAIYHDITELQRARQEAVAANEAKSAFLATMSHEIRTPMNAVIGMSGLLLDTQLSKEQRDYAETIRNSGDALLAIINDILDFSKIEAGKMDLERQPFDLRDCVESALDLVAGRAVEKSLDLAYIIDDDVPIGIRGDVTRLRQILLNLLSNAVKFTDKGEVVLTVKREKARDCLLFAVRDTGIGIPRNRMDRLFTSFSQADSSTTRRYGGTGLGLAISKRLAEMMGGTMWADSSGAGKGSTFAFMITAEAAPVSERKTSRELRGVQPALQGKRVLVVDDNATNRRILMLQTQKWGMEPRETESPREALKWLKRGEPFDIAILDLQMPEMDGVMLTRELRQLKQVHALPVILLTSLGRKEVGADDLDFSAYLTKPLKPSALFDALAGIFARNLVTPRPEPAKALIDTEMAKNHPLRILLAEDNAVNQKLALRLLQQMGYRADVASNGIEAVESVQRQTYDVILMDVQMPEMDGLDATRAIRKLKVRAQPRIVAMTANAMQGDREMCIAAGMEDYISKPIRVAELSAALMNSGARKPVRRAAPKKAAASQKKTPAKKPASKRAVKAASRSRRN